MIKLTDILNEVYGDKVNLDDKWWAILVDSPEDWEILSQFLASKGYKFESGSTFSGKDLLTFNPFKDEQYFDSQEYDTDSDDMGYKANMNYQGKNEFILFRQCINHVNTNDFRVI